MEQGDLVQERYRLESILGTGGMAAVWLATDARLERSVAIKFLAPQFKEDPEFLVRFFAEAQSVARISHPNVVSVLDFGEFDDAPYLVMEYVPGGPVTELTGAPVEPERALGIVRDAALGAGAAHELDIVHRDIKPGNILLTEDGLAKVADFGIARSAVGEKLTATGHVIGSPHYVAPEQASGRGVGPESDVYALGVVLYELLTGRPPFDADNAMTIAIAHVEQRPEAPSTRAEIPAELDALILRCLEKEPEARFRNGDELARALEEAMPSIAPAVMGAGAAPTEVAAVGATRVDERVTGELEAVRVESVLAGDRKKLVAVGVVALLLAGLAWAGILGATGDPGPEESVAGAAVPPETSRRTPDQDGEVESAAPVVATSTPTPTPTPAPDDEPTEDDDSDRSGASGSGSAGSGPGGSGSGGSGGGSEEASPPPSPAPEPSEPEPTPSG